MRLQLRLTSKTTARLNRLLTSVGYLIDQWWDRANAHAREREEFAEGPIEDEINPIEDEVNPIAWEWRGLALYREGELVLRLEPDEEEPDQHVVVLVDAPFERACIWLPVLNATETMHSRRQINRFVQAVWPNEGAPAMPEGADAVGGAGALFTGTPGVTDPTVRSASWVAEGNEMRLVCDSTHRTLLQAGRWPENQFDVVRYDPGTAAEQPPEAPLSADALDAYVAKAWAGWSIPPVPRAKVTKPSLWSWKHVGVLDTLWETIGDRSPLKRVSVEKCHGSVERWAIRFNGNGAPDFINTVGGVNLAVQLRYPEAPPLPIVASYAPSLRWAWTPHETSVITQVLSRLDQGHENPCAAYLRFEEHDGAPPWAISVSHGWWWFPTREEALVALSRQLGADDIPNPPDDFGAPKGAAPSNWYWTTEGSTHVLWERENGYATRRAEVSVTDFSPGWQWRARCGGEDAGKLFSDLAGAERYVQRAYPQAPPIPVAAAEATPSEPSPPDFTAPVPTGLHWRWGLSEGDDTCQIRVLVLADGAERIGSALEVQAGAWLPMDARGSMQDDETLAHSPGVVQGPSGLRVDVLVYPLGELVSYFQRRFFMDACKLMVYRDVPPIPEPTCEELRDGGSSP